jgi:D-sedoheptulose 7-phosphate isomerase
MNQFKETDVESMHQDLIETLVQFKPLLPSVFRAGIDLIQSLKSGKKILTIGNGGSAADALHLSEELVGRFNCERRSLPAICLASDSTIITCISNDYGFENVFARQIEGLGNYGDILVVFSTSGQSANIVNGMKAAICRGIKVIALLGKDGGAAKNLADCAIIVPGVSTARIQEVHTFVLHCWLSQIEGLMFQESKAQ